MKLRIEATPGELQTKGDTVLQTLAENLETHAPDTAAKLRKALQPDAQHSLELVPPPMKDRALEDSRQTVVRLYEQTLTRMRADIGRALDERVAEMVGTP